MPIVTKPAALQHRGNSDLKPEREEEKIRGGGASPSPSVTGRGGRVSVFLPSCGRISGKWAGDRGGHPNPLKSLGLFFRRSPPKKPPPSPATTAAEVPWGSQGAIIAPCFPSFCYFPDPAPKKRPPASRKIRSGGVRIENLSPENRPNNVKMLFWQKLGYLTHKQCLW